MIPALSLSLANPVAPVAPIPGADPVAFALALAGLATSAPSGGAQARPDGGKELPDVGIPVPIAAPERLRPTLPAPTAADAPVVAAARTLAPAEPPIDTALTVVSTALIAVPPIVTGSRAVQASGPSPRPAPSPVPRIIAARPTVALAALAPPVASGDTEPVGGAPSGSATLPPAPPPPARFGARVQPRARSEGPSQPPKREPSREADAIRRTEAEPVAPAPPPTDMAAEEPTPLPVCEVLFDAPVDFAPPPKEAAIVPAALSLRGSRALPVTLPPGGVTAAIVRETPVADLAEAVPAGPPPLVAADRPVLAVPFPVRDVLFDAPVDVAPFPHGAAIVPAALPVGPGPGPASASIVRDTPVADPAKMSLPVPPPVIIPELPIVAAPGPTAPDAPLPVAPIMAHAAFLRAPPSLTASEPRITHGSEWASSTRPAPGATVGAPGPMLSDARPPVASLPTPPAAPITVAPTVALAAPVASPPAADPSEPTPTDPEPLRVERTSAAPAPAPGPVAGPAPAVRAAPTSGPASQVFAAELRRASRPAGGPAPAEVAAPLLAPATPAAAPALDAAPVDLRQERWPHAMVERIERLRDQAAAGDTRVRLIPDALGAVDVAVRREGDLLHVQLVAEQPATRAALAEAAPRLAEAAEARGLKLGQMDVGGGGPGQNRDDRRQPAPLPSAPARPRAAADVDDTDTRIA